MTSASGKCGRKSVFGDGGLRSEDGGNGFECYPEIDILTIGDASLYASAIVC